MTLSINGNSIIEIILVTFLTSVLLVPVMKRIAEYVGAMDYPNERKIHKTLVPRLGGLAIYSSFILGYMLYGQVTTQMISILIGSFIIIMMGTFDDIKPIRAKYKFLIQVIAASIVVIYGQVFFTNISFLGLEIYFNLFFSYILSIFFIVSITNAINLIDGMDGLASGISSIYFFTIGILAFILNKMGGLDITLSFIMLGSTLGFLVHNFPPAKIFMGDSGSQFLGFMISVIALLGFKVATLTSLVIPITILAIPIFDTILAIFRRILKHKNIGSADKEHLHHQLLRLKFSPRISVLIIYLISIIFSAMSIIYTIGNKKEIIVLYLILLLLLIYIILKTDILFEHKGKKKNEKISD